MTESAAGAAVFDAIRAGDVAALRTVLTQDASLAGARDERGLSAVRFARYHGRTDFVDLLLDQRPELDVFDAAAVGDTGRVGELVAEDASLVAAYSEDGFTPLHLAVFFGHPDSARLLLDRGADVNPVSRNAMRVMPLHSAVAGADVASARLLVERGADVNATSHEGWTPLHGAGQHGNEELARILLDAGADRSARMDAGQTPAEIAAASGHDRLAELLRSPTASPA